MLKSRRELHQLSEAAMCEEAEVRTESVEQAHAWEKAARNLACDLPLNPFEAERICRALRGDELTLGAVGAWCRALEDALDASVFGYGRSEGSSSGSEAFLLDAEAARHLVREKIHRSLMELDSQGRALLRALGGENPPQSRRIQGASAAGWKSPLASHPLTSEELMQAQRTSTSICESPVGGSAL